MRVVLTALSALIAIVLLMGGCSYQWYEYRNDLGAVQTRAQVAANREDVLRYVRELRAGYERHDATSGHAALIFKYPSNDLALQYHNLKRIEERLDALSAEPVTSTTYQVALDDIRGTLREFPDITNGLIWARRAWWTMLAVIGILIAAALILTLDTRRFR
jgi:hypothetical protein